jgi:hypothetical protein
MTANEVYPIHGPVFGFNPLGPSKSPKLHDFKLVGYNVGVRAVPSAPLFL